MFDFEGDGRAEILYNDELFFRVYDGRTGALLVQQANPSTTLFEYPVVADIDNDGRAEVVIGLGSQPTAGGYVEIREDLADGLMHNTWAQVDWAAYNNGVNATTLPAIRER